MSLNVNVSFNKEINALLNKLVKVTMGDAKQYYIGELSGYDASTSSIVLNNVIDEKKNKINKIIIHGGSWTLITTEKPPFPMEALSEKIAKVFPPGQVKFQPDSNTISCLNGKIIVSEKGVEGAGPTAERVNKIFEEFLEEQKKN